MRQDIFALLSQRTRKKLETFASSQLRKGSHELDHAAFIAVAHSILDETETISELDIKDYFIDKGWQEIRAEQIQTAYYWFRMDRKYSKLTTKRSQYTI